MVIKLGTQRVMLEGMILQPNMVVPGFTVSVGPISRR
jgi:fructose-bisphosphate aldolase class 1